MTDSKLSPADMSHAMLVAVLMHNGGSLTLPREAFDGDALTGADGAWHAVGMEPQPDGTVRLAVQARPDGESAGMLTLPAGWECPRPGCRIWNAGGAVCANCDTPRPRDTAAHADWTCGHCGGTNGPSFVSCPACGYPKGHRGIPYEE